MSSDGLSIVLNTVRCPYLSLCTADHCPRLHVRIFEEANGTQDLPAFALHLAQTVFVFMEPHTMTGTAGSRFENAFRLVLLFCVVHREEKKR